MGVGGAPCCSHQGWTLREAPVTEGEDGKHEAGLVEAHIRQTKDTHVTSALHFEMEGDVRFFSAFCLKTKNVMEKGNIPVAL